LTILVTGARGFAGGHLLDRLLDPEKAAGSRLDVVAWRRPGNSKALEPASWPRARWQDVDLLDGPAVYRAIAEIRPAIVYHCAGYAHVGRAWDDVEATLAGNVRATHNLFEALRREHLAARVVFPSSALVYATSNTAVNEDAPLLPDSPYGLSKLAQELLGGHALADGLKVVIARAFNHFGPRQDPWFVASGFARRIADIEAGRWKPEIDVGNLDARRDLTDVRDTVRAYQLIVDKGRAGRAYNVCSGRAVKIGDLLEMLLARAKMRIAVKIDPARYRRTTHRFSSATRAAFTPSWDGRPKFRSSGRSTIS
jgi:GDP-4-dehydro-6-deoxy-D-mannose reductase